MTRARHGALAALISLWLSACATTAPRPGLAPVVDSPNGAASAEPAPAPPDASVEPLDSNPGPAASALDGAAAPAASNDLWQRLAGRFEFAQCEPATTQRMLRVYGARPDSFTSNLRRALPQLAYVADAVEAHALPGEFALLPLVESDFASHAVRGGAAGIWQLMPATAREQGLRVDREYDGRLDLGASTRTAMRLIHKLRDRFPQDWRLVDMAYNAGHYRVAMAMAVVERRGLPVVPAELQLPRITHEHVAKLEALACMVRDPTAYGVQLPQALTPEERLIAVAAPPGLPFELVLRLARVDYDRLRSLNRGFLKGHVPNATGYELVLPAPQAARLEHGLAQLPRGQAGSFAYAKLAEATSWETLARASQVPSELLAGINGVASNEPIRAGARLYLPAAALSGVVAVRLPDRSVERRPAGTPSSLDRVTIQSGDTLWDLATRHGTTVAQLQQLNALAPDAVLRPGRQLRLRGTSDTAGIGGVSGASR